MISLYILDRRVLCRVGQKTRLFVRIDNFAIFNGRKVCNMSRLSDFCLEKAYTLHVSAFKYSLYNVHDLHYTSYFAEIDRNDA